MTTRPRLGFPSARMSIASIAVFIMLSVAAVRARQCYWCGPLAEQVHRSRRAPPCGSTVAHHVTHCEPGYNHCAVVATSPPYTESRYCVKLYQDECYPLFCNSTKTWRMTCPCQGDLCNGANEEREKEAFSILSKLVSKSRIIKRATATSELIKNNKAKIVNPDDEHQDDNSQTPHDDHQLVNIPMPPILGDENTQLDDFTESNKTTELSSKPDSILSTVQSEDASKHNKGEPDDIQPTMLEIDIKKPNEVDILLQDQGYEDSVKLPDVQSTRGEEKITIKSTEDPNSNNDPVNNNHENKLIQPTSTSIQLQIPNSNETPKNDATESHGNALNLITATGSAVVKESAATTAAAIQQTTKMEVTTDKIIHNTISTTIVTSTTTKPMQANTQNTMELVTPTTNTKGKQKNSCVRIATNFVIIIQSIILVSLS